MAVDINVISKLERLAKLKLGESERQEIAEDLEKMLNMVDKLSEIDTEGVEPLLYMHDEVNVLRKDEVSDVLDKEAGLSNAPKRIGDYFAVPKIIKK